MSNAHDYRTSITNPLEKLKTVEPFLINLQSFYFSVIWDIMRTWVKRHPLKKGHENSPGHVILSKPPQTEVSFEFKPGANPASRQLKMTRFPENPEPEWGPKAR